jgi:hypothetical protein
MQRQVFGVVLSDVDVEFKGEKVLKRKVFRFAAQEGPMDPQRRTALAAAFLRKGLDASRAGVTQTGQTRDEFTAYGQACVASVSELLALCDRFRVRVFASIVDPSAPRPTQSDDFLRKDYVYLFQRYFYHLETFPPGGPTAEMRNELEPFARQIAGMRFRGDAPSESGTGTITLEGVTFLADLRGRNEREVE